MADTLKEIPQSGLERLLGKIGRFTQDVGSRSRAGLQAASDVSPLSAAAGQSLLTDPLERAGAALQDWSATPRDITSEQPYSRLLSGAGQTTRLDTRALDVAMFAQPIASVWAKTAPKIAKSLINEALAPRSGRRAQEGAVKLGGGNWTSRGVDDALRPLKKDSYALTPAQVIAARHERLGGIGLADAKSAAGLDTYGEPLSRRELLREMSTMRAYKGTHRERLEQLLLLPHELAVDTWVDKQMRKYLTDKLATPDDSIRIAADAWPAQQTKLLEAKQAQLDKAVDARDKLQVERNVAPEVLTRSNARIRELETEKRLIKYRKGLHGGEFEEYANDNPFAELTPADMFDTNLAIKRADAGMPAEGFGKTPMGKAWENATDEAIRSTPAGKAAALRWFPDDTAWIKKLPRDTPIYNVNPNSTGTPLGFSHLFDEIRNAVSPTSTLPAQFRIDAKDLSKWTVPQMSEHVDKINAWRKVQSEDAINAAREGVPVHKEYPEGYQWLALPDLQTNPEALKYATEVGCQGGWCTEGANTAMRYGSGDNRLYVLHNPEGKAVVQISTAAPHRGDFIVENSSIYDDMRQEGAEFARRWVDQELLKQPSRIVEIKGLQNKMPSPEDLPFIQDFVRSGKWSAVGDLHNTGLYKTHGSTGLSRDILPEMSGSARQLAYGRASHAGDVQPYMTKTELEAAMKKHAPEDIWSRPGQPMTEADITGPWEPEGGMKRGGPVNQTIAQAKSKQTGQYNVQHVRKPSQYERDFDQRMQAEQIARQNAVKRGVSSWVPEIPGFAADLLVDAPYNLVQRAAGKRGDNIKPLGFGEDVRRGVSQALGMAPASLGEAGMSMPPDETNEAVTTALQLANPLMWGAAWNPVAIARATGKGAKALAPTAAKLAEDYFMRTGQILPVIKPSGGNWLQGNVENSMKGLRSRGPTEFDREWLIRHADQEPIASQRGLQAIPQNEAINQFVDKQLTGYVKNQMGTAGDPIRLAADAFPEQKAKLLFDKQKQIDKATADMEKARLARGFTPEMMTRSQARIRELEKERELIELRTGLHYEPQSAEVASDQARRAAGYPPDPVSTSPLGQAWENISDRAIEGAPYRMRLPMVTPETAPDALRALGGEFAVQNPNAMAYSVLGGEFNDVLMRGNLLGFGHIIDELRNATNPASGLPKELLIDSKNLSKWTVQQSVEHVDKINAWRAAQKAEADLVRANNAATVMHKDYPEKGMKWVELRLPETPTGLPEGWRVQEKAGVLQARSPDGNLVLGESMPELVQNIYLRHPDTPGNPKAALESALKYEGEQLQHCVGGYCPDVVSGKSRIFSLRDAKGNPHATVEVNEDEVIPPFNKLPDEMQLELHERAHKMHPEIEGGGWPPDFGDIGYEKTIYNLMEEPKYQKTLRDAPPAIQRINQIKGKGNRAPSEEYLPYVQDFVRSGKWSAVGDLHNTGLYRKSDFIDEFTSDQLDSTGIGEYLNMNELKGLREGKPWKPIDTDPELDIDPNLLPPMKRGGPVNQDAMQMAVWNKALRKQVGGELTQAEIDAAQRAAFGAYPKQPATPSSSETKKAVADASKLIADLVIPQTPVDLGLMLLGGAGGKVLGKLGAGIVAAGASDDVEASNLGALMRLLRAESPMQMQQIRKALGQAFTTGNEHSVVGPTHSIANEPRRVGRITTQGKDFAVAPDQFDVTAAVKSKSPIMDFHSHPNDGRHAFAVAPSSQDFHFAENQYFPGRQSRELKTLIASPADAELKTPTSYSFFATDNPSKTFDRRAYEAAVYELQRSGKKIFKDVIDNPEFRDYFEHGGHIGNWAEDVSPLALLKLRELQGLGRGKLQLSGAPVTASGATNIELYKMMQPAATEFLRTKKFDKGGLVNQDAMHMAIWNKQLRKQHG